MSLEKEFDIRRSLDVNNLNCKALRRGIKRVEKKPLDRKARRGRGGHDENQTKEAR